MNKYWIAFIIGTLETDTMLFFTFYFGLHGHPFAAAGAFVLAVAMGDSAAKDFKEIK